MDVSSLPDNKLQDTPFSRAAKSGARDARDGDVQSELQSVIDAWPHLPEAVKAKIVAMVKAACT